jgi:hypothetical protein
MLPNATASRLDSRTALSIMLADGRRNWGLHLV